MKHFRRQMGDQKNIETQNKGTSVRLHRYNLAPTAAKLRQTVSF